MAGKQAVLVAVELLTGCSGEGWSAEKGVYHCPRRLAAMLVKRGYALPVPN